MTGFQGVPVKERKKPRRCAWLREHSSGNKRTVIGKAKSRDGEIYVVFQTGQIVHERTFRKTSKSTPTTTWK